MVIIKNRCIPISGIIDKRFKDKAIELIGKDIVGSLTASLLISLYNYWIENHSRTFKDYTGKDINMYDKEFCSNRNEMMEEIEEQIIYNFFK